MLIQITASLITENGKHTVSLPQTQNEFDNTLKRIHILTGDQQEYKICNVSSNLYCLNRLLTGVADIEELNFLAQLLEGFSEREARTFCRFLDPRTMSVTMQDLINIAYSFYEFSFNHYKGVFFPAFDYEINYILKITLSKYGGKSGVDIILPASDTIIDRALHRLGADSVDDCYISKCVSWNFEALETIQAFGGEVLVLNELIKKMSEKPKYEIDAYLEIMSENDHVMTVSELERFVHKDSFLMMALKF